MVWLPWWFGCGRSLVLPVLLSLCCCCCCCCEAFLIFLRCSFPGRLSSAPLWYLVCVWARSVFLSPPLPPVQRLLFRYVCLVRDPHYPPPSPVPLAPVRLSISVGVRSMASRWHAAPLLDASSLLSSRSCCCCCCSAFPAPPSLLLLHPCWLSPGLHNLLLLAADGRGGSCCVILNKVFLIGGSRSWKRSGVGWVTKSSYL